MLKRLIVLLVFLLTIPQVALALGRVDTEGATVDNKFTEGNQALAEPATVLGAAWLNDIQEELVGIVEASGQTPAKGAQGQLKRALIVKVSTIADLRALTPSGSMAVQPMGYYSPGDGGGGPVRYGVSGAAPGTYVDNGGSIVVPDGGDGSAAWLWKWSGPINVRWFGAVGDGVADDGPAIQAAITDVIANGSVLVPDGDFALKTPVALTGKNVTLDISGLLLDRLPSFTLNYNDLFTGGKGLFAFSGGEVSIVGHGHVSLDGGRGETGVSQTTRPFFYFYNTSGGSITGLAGGKFLAAAVATYEANGLTHRDCIYDSGEFTVFHSRGDDLNIDNVKVTNAAYCGIVVHNRGGFPGDGSVLPLSRPQRVQILNSSTRNTTSVNSYAVGITADNCDDIKISGNFVDGNNVGTMAYSFAGSIGGQVYGNRARNLTNIANGTYTYAGIGMECDGVEDMEFFGNTFDEILIGYLVLSAKGCSFDGRYACDAARESVVTTGAGQAGMYALGNAVNLSQDLVLSGSSDGGSYVVSGEFYCNGLHIRNMTIRDYFFRAIFFSGSSSISNMTMENIDVSEPGTAKTFFGGTPLDALSDLTVSNVQLRAVGAAPGTAQRVAYLTTTGNKKFRFFRLYAENYDEVINSPYGSLAEITVENSEFYGITEAEILKTAGTTTVARLSGCRLNGIKMKDQGAWADITYGVAAPTTSAKFVGQRFIDTTGLAEYTAVAVGGGAADWKKTTP
jgi:hypothetical protein